MTVYSVVITLEWKRPPWGFIPTSAITSCCPVVHGQRRSISEPGFSIGDMRLLEICIQGCHGA